MSGTIAHDWISPTGDSENALDAIVEVCPAAEGWYLSNDDPKVRYPERVVREFWKAWRPLRRSKEAARSLVSPTGPSRTVRDCDQGFLQRLVFPALQKSDRQRTQQLFRVRAALVEDSGIGPSGTMAEGTPAKGRDSGASETEAIEVTSAHVSVAGSLANSVTAGSMAKSRDAVHPDRGRLGLPWLQAYSRDSSNASARMRSALLETHPDAFAA